MTRFPPLLWPLMLLATLFIFMGASGEWDPKLIALGVVLGIATFIAAERVARHYWGDRDRPASYRWAMIALAAFYLLNAVLAALADPVYSLAALGAALVPATALLILFAVAGAKTATGSGRLEDRSAEDRDGMPGIGFDDESPFGDTPEHSDAERVAKPDSRAERWRSARREGRSRPPGRTGR
jgi:hypothetical protein